MFRVYSFPSFAKKRQLPAEYTRQATDVSSQRNSFRLSVVPSGEALVVAVQDTAPGAAHCLPDTLHVAEQKLPDNPVDSSVALAGDMAADKAPADWVVAAFAAHPSSSRQPVHP